MRIVAGSARGRRLATPKPQVKRGRKAGRGDGNHFDEVRPTSERVREAVFNALHSRDAVVGARVLDLFAGTGALGIEALSRGAGHATFVDRTPVAVSLVETNLEACGLADRATVVRADGPRWLGASSDVWDLVLLDPPYGYEEWDDLLEVVSHHLLGPKTLAGEPGRGASTGIVVVESNHDVSVGSGWHVDSRRRAAGTVVTLLRPVPGPD
ncbi:MAG TPA: 16S rRNA (guanine(966)-N(2))-methyltransferase RsmD [Acidimicrobiaceae bacterium]|nr:16S rRNA (guanine(966)-N(2))-methyltransferase RsmD [Acidimicrobiaceae bacterium]HCV35236.1 16S rRNA (guanine(966)-N(2))-methyltransferase RsmD [Acidimicrobiaceae bacterium]